jgi:hypothetical protein
MAKKQTKNDKTEPVKSELILPKLQNGTLEMPTVVGVDKDDVIAVGLSRAEEQMQTRLNAASQEGKARRQQTEEKRKQIHAQLQAEAETAADPFKEPVETALKALGVKKYDSAKVDYRQPTPDAAGKLPKEYAATFRVAYVTPRDEKNPHASETTEISISRTLLVKTPTSVTQLHAEIKRIEEEIASFDDQVMHWKKKLSNMPVLERRLKARLAEQRLNSSADGMAMLAAMSIDLDNDTLLALPESK